MNIKLIARLLVALVAAGILSQTVEAYKAEAYILERPEEDTKKTSGDEESAQKTTDGDATADDDSDDDDKKPDKNEENEDFKGVAQDFIKGEYDEK